MTGDPSGANRPTRFRSIFMCFVKYINIHLSLSYVIFRICNLNNVDTP